MALIEQLDGIVFQAFQQNFISNIASKPNTLPAGDGKNLYDDGSLSLTKGGPFSIPGLPSALSPLDAFATAHWLRNIGKELFGTINFKDGVTTAATSVMKSKGFQFVSSQILLASLNPKDPELGGGTFFGGIFNAAWNPTSLVASALPFARPTDFTAITAAPVLDLKFDKQSSRIDKYISQVKKEEKLNPSTIPEDILGPGKPSRLPSLFGNKQFSGFERIKEIVSILPPIRPGDLPEPLHARIVESIDGDADGVIEVGNEPTDDKIYMPLVFQDLRDPTPFLLYFRAFIKPDSVTETFTPSWNSVKYYGRVDDVPVYMGTTRIINFSFDVVAWQPADLPIIYRKLHKLQSMVYPFFDAQGFLAAGPIIRMRMGDLFSTFSPNAEIGKRGLPGYLTSLDIAYDNIWNIEAGFKVPRKATVSVSFTALHEGNPGTYPTSATGKEFSTFGVGEFVPGKESGTGTYKGQEIGIRGLLENMKSTREQREAKKSDGSFDFGGTNDGPNLGTVG